MILGCWLGQRRWAGRWLLGFFWAVVLQAANVTPLTRDTLVYKDGDRVQGALVQQTADAIVFRSDRFGEIRVSAADAVVIKAEKPAVAATAAAPTTSATAPVAPVPVPAPPPAPPTAAEQAHAVGKAETDEEERMTIWDRFSPSVLTAKVRNYFGPWHGRLSFSSEVVSDVADRGSTLYEGHLQRKWKADEVQLTVRYDYSETNDVATTDIYKAGGQWRHDFNKTLFAHYRPSSEWNRASKLRTGEPSDYILLQQEVGVGYNFLTKPSRKVRVGVSQNLFDTWTTAPVEEHSSRGVVSTFEEMEFNLPWRMTISQRGVYYPVKEQADGWENRFELIKKLTETLSTSVRHEIRRNNPDGSAQDYTRLKLLFGLDF